MESFWQLIYSFIFLIQLQSFILYSFFVELMNESNEKAKEKHVEKEEGKNENRSFRFTSSIEKVKDVSIWFSKIMYKYIM